MDKKSKTNTGTIIAVATLSIAVLAFLFGGEGVLNQHKPKTNTKDTVIIIKEILIRDTLINTPKEKYKPKPRYTIKEPLAIKKSSLIPKVFEESIPIKKSFSGIFLNDQNINKNSVLNEILSHIDTSLIESIKIQYTTEGKRLKNKYRLDKCLFSFSIDKKKYKNISIKPIRYRKDDEEIRLYIESSIRTNIINTLKNSK